LLFVERSNRTEVLFEGLAARLEAKGRDPLARAVVVVQGAGMERWIAQGIARRQGVCANVEFPFPRPFLEQVFAALPAPRDAGGAGGTARAGAVPWDLDRMTWAIAALIDGARADGDFAPLARHLGGRDADWRLIQLARQIADVFDQYITYRPDWVLCWEGLGPPPGDLPAGPDAVWQRRLFRALRERLGEGHIAHRAAAFLAALDLAPAFPPAVPPGGRAGLGARPDRRAVEAELRRRFPDAVEIFAVSTLPRLHLEVVRGLARVVDVRLSILAPSRIWYADLWRELRDGDAGAVAPADGIASAAPGPVAGLLAGLGRLGADFQRVLVESASPDGGEHERFDVPGDGRAEASLLERLQALLLDLDDAAEARSSRPIERDDDSLRVHFCHGARRELEVVEGVLRQAFERDPTLRPEDVIVMAPDIDAIAGDVDAVFGPDADRAGGIPYRIADRGAFRRSPVADAFRALLGLVSTRMARSAVFDWLALGPVAARFGLDEKAVELIADWAERAGVRFGVDEAQREALGLPAERGHTLAGGLDRLVLAHALGPVPDVVAGLSPVALDPFADAAWIGALGEVESLLAAAVRDQRESKTVAEWTSWLATLLARSALRDDANSHEHAALLAVLERLRVAAEATAFTRKIPFEVIRERVLRALEESPSPQAFLAGGVTFCQLVPLRAIPFRVVVVTGLVDGAFPRSRAAIGFDAMARRPRAGDRSLRDDDRHLFLEAILSARDRLVLTVPAHDLRSGKPMPPSIVVAELLDAVAGSFALDGEGEGEGERAATKLRDWLVVKHPLQESSPRHFERGRDPRLVPSGERAYRAACARATASAAEIRPLRRFLASGGEAETPIAPEPAIAAGPRDVLALEALIERVLRSTRRFAREIVGLQMPRPEAAAEDLDPIAPDPLARSVVGRSLFGALAEGVGWDEAVARLRADPEMPVGPAGDVVARALAVEVRALAEIAAERRAGRRLPDLAFTLPIPATKGRSEVRLDGRLDDLFEGARVEAAYARIGGRREAALWIRHLVLCALRDRGESVPETSVLVGRPAHGDTSGACVVEFPRIEDPLPLLTTLVEWAIAADDAPIPFFERASRAFAKEMRKDAPDEVKAWRDARSQFDGRDESGNRFAEADQELETARVWEGLSPIAPTEETGIVPGFDEVARAFFEPLDATSKRMRR